MIDIETELRGAMETIAPRPGGPDWREVLEHSSAFKTRRRRRAFIRTGLGAAVVSGCAFAAFAVLGRGGMTFTDRALAALGGGPVLHAVIRQERVPSGSMVQLSTGRTRRHVAETEYWFQPSPRRLEIHYLRDGSVTSETYNTRSGGISSSGARSKPGGYQLTPDLALLDFLTGYQAALKNHRAQVVGHGTVNGKRVTEVSIPYRRPGFREIVVVDSATYRPIMFHILDTRTPRYSSPPEKIVSIETVALSEAPFGVKVMLQPSVGRARDAGAMTMQAATSALGRPGLWAAERLGGLPLIGIERQALTAGYPRRDHKQPIHHTGLQLSYGTLGPGRKLDWHQPFVEIQESSTPGMAYGFQSSPAGPLTFNGNPVPPLGWIDLLTAPSADNPDQIWMGQLQKDGVFVTIRASSRALLMHTARSLVRLPG